MRSAEFALGRDQPGPRVRASAATGICEKLRQAGVNPQALLDPLRLREEILADHTAWISLADYCRLLERAAVICGKPSFGWEVGQAHATSILEQVVALVETAPTLMAGLTVAAQTFAIIQEQTSLSLHQQDGELFLTYQILDGRIIDRRQDAELKLGALVTLIRRILGPHWNPQEVHFEHPRGASEVRHHVDVCYGAQFNAIMIPPEFQTSIIRSADPQRHAMLLRQLPNCLGDFQEDDLVGRVSQLIRDSLATGQPGAQRIARRLGLSRPMLYRRLLARGVEFSELQRELRRELALSYLRDENLPLSEIALSLGYSELSAFSRAFRSWTDLSPLEFRRCYEPGEPNGYGTRVNPNGRHVPSSSRAAREDASNVAVLRVSGALRQTAI